MSKRFFRSLILLMMVLCMSVPVFATGISSADSYETLRRTCEEGDYTCMSTGEQMDYSTNQYPASGGGFLLYTEITGVGDDTHQFVVPQKLDQLTAKGKQDFLKDMLRIANGMVADTESGNSKYTELSGGVTTETLDSMLRVLQNNAGMGSQLLATLLSETKPDYATANKIYAPFSGIIGTIIALVAILIMALLGVTMTMDIAYITIPAFQMACGGAEGAGGQGQNKSGGVGALISAEAKKAVKAADDGGGGQAGSGEYKAAVGIYLKYRWKGLTLLGLCLVYLIQGQIYNFVAWFVDLFSGFLGF